MNTAKKILDLEKQWQEIDKRHLNDNIRAALYSRGIVKYADHIGTLMEITGASRHSAQSWLNYSREDVKIPFIKFCKIVAWLDMDIEKMLKIYPCDSEIQEENFKYIFSEMTK